MLDDKNVDHSSMIMAQNNLKIYRMGHQKLTYFYDRISV